MVPSSGEQSLSELNTSIKFPSDSAESERRKERRLCSWQRHERSTVRMQLTTAFDHSAGPETIISVRSQKMVVDGSP